METRIKVKQRRNGTALYIPQYKSFFFWWDFVRWLSIHTQVSVWFEELSEAQEFIDEELKYDAERNGHKIISTSYIKYP